MWDQTGECGSPLTKRDEYDQWCFENLDVIAGLPEVASVAGKGAR